MPSKPHNPAVPTVYLDWSTLSQAFHGALIGRESERYRGFAGLLRWVEQVAAEANLCMSLFHIAEMARMPDTTRADAIARWLDSLSLVWTRSNADIADDEDDYWLQRAVGIRVERPRPFAASLLVLNDRLTPADSVGLLRNLTIPAVLSAVRLAQQKDRLAGVADEQEMGLRAAREFHEDRHAHRAHSPSWKRERIASNDRLDLQRRAAEAHQRMGAVAVHSGRNLTLDDVTDPFVEAVLASVAFHPIWHVERTLMEGFAAAAALRQPTSRTTLLKAPSTTMDHVHALIGATFCDVFTCDEETSAWLGNIRERLGRRRQIAFSGGEAGAQAFVQELISAWP